MAAFTIDFDKLDRKYKPGDTVYCKIKIIVFSLFRARSLSVRFKGFAHTKWRKARQRYSNENDNVYDYAEEVYFRSFQYMFGDQSVNERDVAEGTYHYNVHFVLPGELPSSFEHKYGHIRYNVKVRYDIPWKLDKEELASFYVVSSLDLSNFPNLQRPINQTEEKVFISCCCFKSDPMQLINVLPKAGFVVGEMIPVTIKVDNSQFRIDYIKIQLKETITFYVRHPKPDLRSVTNTIDEYLIETPVLPFKKQTFTKNFYVDPIFKWKLLNICKIITCHYSIHSEAVVSGFDFRSNVENNTKIVIGCPEGLDMIQIINDIPVINEPSAPIIIHAATAPTGVFNPTIPENGVIIEQPLPTYFEVASRGHSPILGASGAPLASTEKIFFDEDQPPPSYEDSQKNPNVFGGERENIKTIEAEEVSQSAPSEPIETTPPQPPT